MDPRVKHVVGLIQNDLAGQRTMTELASEVSLTGGHLRHLFRREIGLTALKYRQKLRLIEAKRLLVETALPVAEVMRRVGLTDESHFSRDFKAQYGMSPRSYRAEHRPTKDNRRPDKAHSRRERQ